jgi:UDP-N-acetylglucosamine:LPS N-acetylglucosamine transferase
MKVLLVCTSGGHFATMRNLEPFWSEHESSWVCDRNADTEALTKTRRVNWLPYQAPRDVLAIIKNIPATLRILLKERPDLVLSTGASIAVNFCFLAKLLGIRVAYVESISRSHDLSLSGRLIYAVCDDFYVQWPELCKKYPKTTFMGYAA